VDEAEWAALRGSLTAAGVRGAEELGRFVNNTEYFPASRFDERAAMPVLLAALPGLTDPRLVDAVAGHLRRPWARPMAFEPLHAAFCHWAPINTGAGWQLGDSMASAATAANLGVLLTIAQDTAFGTCRQMVVFSLRRYRKHPEVVPVLIALLDDGDVVLHAASALRVVLGPAAAVPHVEAAADRHRGNSIGERAAREARKMRKALAKTERG
jgi:hypothetical protein